MRPNHQPRSRRTLRHSRDQRSKRPLVVLTYRNNLLDTVYSSTPSVQFVRLDVLGSTESDVQDGDFPPPSQASQLTIPALTDLPFDLRCAAQRAFRRS